MMNIKKSLKELLTVKHPQLKWAYNNLIKDGYGRPRNDEEFLEEVLHVLKWHGKYREGMSENEIVKTYFEIIVSDHLNNRGFKLEGHKKNTIRLEDDKYIHFSFGKYLPNLNFLLDFTHLLDGLKFEKDDFLNKQLNLNYTGDISFVKGRYFKSKKGSDFFDMTDPDNSHVLIKIDWGGSFDDSRGLKTVPNQKLYYRSAVSNGGGMGVDYLILPVDYKATYTVSNF